MRLFRERYPLVAVEKSHLLPGVAGGPGDARDRGAIRWPSRPTSRATFSRMILEAKGVAERFRAVAGPDADDAGQAGSHDAARG